MPAFNVARYVEEAISSVRDQTWQSIELIVVDDGSDDGTDRVVERMAEAWRGAGRTLRFERQPNAGAAAARNTGLDRATGTFVAFLDADDKLYPECLERLVARLDADGELDLTFPQYRYIDEEGASLGVETTAYKPRYEAVDLMIRNPIHSATGVLVRRSVAVRAGRFDPTLEACIDLDFWVRIAALSPGNVAGTERILAAYRKRSGQITGDWRRMRRNWLAVCDKLKEAGHGLSERQFTRGMARQALYWATIAYQSGDYRATRHLTATMWRADPAFAAGDSLARIRTLSAATTLVPGPVHAALRKSFNRARRRTSE